MRSHRILGVGILAGTLGLAFGCSSNDDDDDNDTGGPATGGVRPGTGGSVVTATGGLTPVGQGGTGTGGGLTPTGGYPATGGVATGGSGGDTGTGGQTATGGTSLIVAGECTEFRGLEDCGTERIERQTLEVNVLLVVDKSGSMADTPSGYAETKWNAISDALSHSLAAVKNVLSLGLELFPYTATEGDPIPRACAGPPDRCCEMPTTPDMNVNIGPGRESFNAITGLINTSSPAGGTPTAKALERALAYFTSGAGADLGGDRIVLLATDGGPNCNADITCGINACTLNIDETQGCPPPSDPTAVSCCNANPTGCLDDLNTVAQIEALAEIGVKTIVVGIPGADLYTSTLEQAAEAGEFEKPNGDMGLWMVPTGGGVEGLAEVFEEITTQLVQTCEIAVEQEIPNPNQVNVAVDCIVIPMGTPEGSGDRWYFDNPEDPTKIIIDGPICETIQTEGVERLDVLYECATITGV
jgi:hypothetical protein